MTGVKSKLSAGDMSRLVEATDGCVKRAVNGVRRVGVELCVYVRVLLLLVQILGFGFNRAVP